MTFQYQLFRHTSRIAVSLLVFFFASIASAQDTIELGLSGRLQVEEVDFDGEAKFKIVIGTATDESLWSNDSSSLALSEPSTAFRVSVNNGVFSIRLGGDDTDPISVDSLIHAEQLYAHIWIDAGEGFEKFGKVPLLGSSFAANAARFQGLSPEDFLLAGSSVPVSNGNLTEKISSENLEAFSASLDDFNIGDGESETDKHIIINISGTSDPSLRYDVSSSRWQFSNDGSTFSDIGSSTSSGFIGTGSVSDAVDLATGEISGILPLVNGGTGAGDTITARDNLGLEIGVDVAPFVTHNLSASSDPGASDDNTLSYQIGSFWINTTSGEAFIATNVTTGAAVWASTTSTDASSLADGSVTNAKLATDSVASTNITDGSIALADLSANSVSSSQVVDNSLTTADLAPNSCDASEIASSGVSSGSYTLASITVDEDGRITSASSGSAGTITGIGDVASGAAFGDGTFGSELVYEGATVDAFETRLSFAGDPGADSIVTIPNTAGTLITDGDTGTVTGTMVANSTLTNDDLSASANILLSKLEAVNSGNIIVGNGTNTAAAVSMSGDATISNAGALTIADNSVDGSDLSLSGEAAGDIMYHNGTDWVRLAAGTSGKILSTTGTAPTWQSANYALHPIYSQRMAMAFPLGPTATTLTGIGIANPTATGTATAQPAMGSGTRMYIRWATAATANTLGGLGGAYTMTRPGFRPRMTSYIRTDAALTTRRIWVGLSEAALTTATINTTATTASTNDFVAIAYGSDATGNNTDWLCCSGDGTNYSCSTTGVAVAANTEYLLDVDWRTEGTLSCTVNSTTVTKTTNLSTNATNIGAYNGVTTLTATSIYHYSSGFTLEQNS